MSANPGYQEPASPTQKLSALQLGTEGGVPLVAEHVLDAPAVTASVSSVAAAAVDTLLFAANANRIMAIVFNDSDRDCWVKCGSGAGAGSFTSKITPQGEWRAPLNWKGLIHGIWGIGVAGAARLTELTP